MSLNIIDLLLGKIFTEYFISTNIQ